MNASSGDSQMKYLYLLTAVLVVSTTTAPARSQSSNQDALNADRNLQSNQNSFDPSAMINQMTMINKTAVDGMTMNHNMSEDSRPHHSLLHALGDTAQGIGHAAVTLVGATIGDNDIDLPPDTQDNPSWPFIEHKRKAVYTVYWPNGATGAITRLPDGSYQLCGNGRRMTMQPVQGGAFALMGEDGTMGTLTPRLDGGYTLMAADGSSAAVLPRQGGGFNIYNQRGQVAMILPGPAGSKHIIAGGKCSTVR